MKLIRYCGMYLTPEAMAMLGMLGADEYLRMSDAEDGFSEGMTKRERSALANKIRGRAQQAAKKKRGSSEIVRGNP
jgi:hypothetical protein